MAKLNRGSRLASDPELYHRIKSILARYPNITIVENQELLEFLRKEPMLDRALLSGVFELQAQLVRFEADHRRALSLGSAEYAFAGILLLAVLVRGYLLWNAGLCASEFRGFQGINEG